MVLSAVTLVVNENSFAARTWTRKWTHGKTSKSRFRSGEWFVSFTDLFLRLSCVGAVETLPLYRKEVVGGAKRMLSLKC